MADLPQVPGYEIQAEIGRGGMAVVYSAIEPNLDREVAIKIVTPTGEDAEGHLQRLENEARGLAALQHPHIVGLYRFGRTADGALYYVMPLLTGGSLESWPMPVSEEKAVALLDHLLDALAHAHASDIIHRDIKPANILFDRHGRPLLADFGAAFRRQRDVRLTAHGGAIGSSGYMSPEQARGERVDARSDLYSTAVLAFELLTGQRPFTGPDDLAVALAQLEKPVPRLPPALAHWQPFFDRALAVNPAQRYADAAEMRAAMHALRSPPASGVSLPMRPLALAAGALVLVALALAVWKWRAPSAPTTADAAAPTASLFGTSTPKPADGEGSDASATAAEPANKPPTDVGDRFQDDGGPALVLAKVASGSKPALAIMAQPVDTALYKRYAEARKREPVTCADTVAPAQGCLSLTTAKDLASWLSTETGEKYRVPTRTELQDGLVQVATVAKADAWTSTCNEVRVARPRNAAQRGWANIRKAFGKPKPVQYDVRCEGYFTLPLSGATRTAQVHEGATPETVAVLVREMPISSSEPQ